ncbi:hypothetical protein AcV5_009110 [Taiwanofungus camphoratus]|nr:hypothetical protein AcV5_009110 [Antrodia cinnamomea]
MSASPPSNKMPVPPTLTSYLPVLLVSVAQSAVPDDTSFSTQPESQVDYLSHEWREEDVWRSWRSMTRQKNAISNGMRLENASWRTWWKQRNKLKTISPETLNWLKDSDVTWLYGPLHVGSDWIATSQASKALRPAQRQHSSEAVSAAAPATGAKKPILKRRSISQLLSLPSSPWFDQGDVDDDEAAEYVREEQAEAQGPPKRPPLTHTKSDTHISLRGRPYRKDSPPRIIAEESPQHSRRPSAALTTLTTTTSSDVSHSTSSDQDLSGSSSAGPDSSVASGTTGDAAGLKKKHISFNTFVEQCIAIEKPKLKRTNSGHGPHVYNASSDDGYEEDSEIGYSDEYDSPSSSYVGGTVSGNSDSEDDDDDDVLEMRTSRSRSSSISMLQQPTTTLATEAPPSASALRRPSLVRGSSTGGDRVTIAPIAPTILKSTGVGNNLVAVGAGRVAHAAKEVELVYVPPSHGTYSLPGTPNMGAASEDVYHHRESYFSVGTARGSPQIPSVGVFPPSPQRQQQAALPPPRYSSPSGRTHFPRQPVSDVSEHVDELGDGTMEDAFDYLEGPDTAEDFSEWSTPGSRRRRSRSDMRDESEGGVAGVVRYAEGGAASVTTGRSSGGAQSPYSPSRSPEMPVVVVNEANGATEERTERSREGSPSLGDMPSGMEVQDVCVASPVFVHSPSSAVAVPRIGTTHPHISFSPQVMDAALLSPSDICRGRPLPVCSSVSGSTTTGSSYTRSTDSRSDSRGRSLTRNSSFSDRERSSSRGTSSPMGSLSPTGSALALGSAHVKGRESRGSSRSGRVGSDEAERGRERTGRRLGDSISPPNPLGSPTRENDGGEQQAYSPIMAAAPLDRAQPCSPPSSISGSSTASVSTVRQAPANDSEIVTRPRIIINPAASYTPPLLIPSPIPEEEEQRSRQPTPANSPVFALNPIMPAPQDSAYPKKAVPRVPQSSPVSPPRDSKAYVSGPPSSPTSRPRDRVARGSVDGHQDTSGSLVGRAVDMVTSARGFFGAIWNAGAT